MSAPELDQPAEPEPEPAAAEEQPVRGALGDEGARGRPGIYYQDRVLVLASTGGG
jgi:hypothetical protein